ncbi:uncharacterized mitochondrial protein-like protein, partial [Tanacetum coccineum]
HRPLLSLYVDDMIITGDNCVGIKSLKLELAHRFAMKDLGLLRYFLGIEVASSPKGYLLSQSKYIGDLLDRTRITNKMVEDIPIDAKAKYTPTYGDPLLDPSLYRTIVGSLVYLTVTHPNISYAVHIVSQFVWAPTVAHWAAVLHILRFLYIQTPFYRRRSSKQSAATKSWRTISRLNRDQCARGDVTPSGSVDPVFGLAIIEGD